MAERYEHRLDKAGRCKRCALTPAHAKYCPPGFWMTKAEKQEWDAVPFDDARYVRWNELERRFRERPMGRARPRG